MPTKTAGYSGTPLPRKLGIKSGMRVGLVSAPTGFEDTLHPLDEDVLLSRRIRRNVDVFVFFPDDASDLERIPRLASGLVENGGLWVAWPKKASGVPTDLDFSIVQGAALAIGLVDNKVCAVSETYSGLRFVYRLKDRNSKKLRT